MLHSCTHSSGAGLPLLRRGTRSCCPCAVVHVAMRPAGVLAAVLAAGAALAGWVTLKAVDAAPPEALAQFPLPLAALVQLRSVALGTVAWVSRMGGNDVAAALANANGMMAAPSGTEDRLNASPASRQLFSIFDRFFDNEQTEDQVLSRWAQVIPGTQSQVRAVAAPAPAPRPRHALGRPHFDGDSRAPRPSRFAPPQFFKGLVSKPLPRFRHIAVPLPSLCAAAPTLAPLRYDHACVERISSLTRLDMPDPPPCVDQDARPRGGLCRGCPRRVERRPPVRHVDLPAQCVAAHGD